MEHRTRAHRHENLAGVCDYTPAPGPAPDPNAGSMGTCFVVSYGDKKVVVTNQHVVGVIKDGINKVIFYGSFKGRLFFPPNITF